MKKLYFGFTDFNRRPIETVVLKGTASQAIVFRKIVFGDTLLTTTQYGDKNPEIIPIIILNDLKFACEIIDGRSTFECSYENKYLFSGYQDELTSQLVILAEEDIPGGEVTVANMCLFPNFEHYAVCENCNNKGSYDAGQGPESEAVLCQCPNTIFTYE